MTIKPARAGRLMYQLPKESRIMRALQPVNNWGWQEILLNRASYLLDVLAWQNTEDAAKGRTESAPKMYTPPFMQDVLAPRALDPNQITRSTDEIKDILSRPRI